MTARKRLRPATTPGKEARGVAVRDGSGSVTSGGGRLSPLIHGRTRLLILSFLLRGGRPQSFTALRKALELTDGALSVQLSKLVDGGMVTVTKTFEGKRPLTVVRLTTKGRNQFRRYVQELCEIVPGLAPAGDR